MTSSGPDRGAFAILYAVLIVALIGISALVVDIAALRDDRRSERSMADASAIAGASALGYIPITPRDACVAALTVAGANYNQVATGAPDCSMFPVMATNCSSVVPKTSTRVFGDTEVVFTWPVTDSSLLMRPDVEREGPVASQPIGASDGSPCHRIGVTASKTRTLIFAGGIGQGRAQTTESHAVALAQLGPGKGQVIAPLVVLDLYSCDALRVNGGGGVLVRASLPSTDPLEPQFPGVIAVNSDGSGRNPDGTDADVTCNGGRHALDADSSVNYIRALDTASGLPGTIFSPSVFSNPDRAYKKSPDATAGCTPSHDSTLITGKICPRPLTGGPVDDVLLQARYDCRASSCASNTDFVSQLRSLARRFIDVGPPPVGVGWTTVSGAACSGPQPHRAGHVFVDCPGGFSPTGIASFDDGAVIFSGSVQLGPSSCLVLNQSISAGDASRCLPPDPAVAIPAYPTAEDSGPVYIEGELRIQAGASLVAPQTFILQTGQLNISTTGRLYWSAPFGQSAVPPATCTAGTRTGTYPSLPEVPRAPAAGCFEDLATWNDFAYNASPPPEPPNQLQGQSGLYVEGTFYLPLNEFSFGGGTRATQTRAQFFAKRLNVSGGGDLEMTPDAARSNPVSQVTAALIR